LAASANERFQRVDALFDAVIDLPTEEQAAYIDQVCADDATLRAEVIQLLRAHHRSGGLLDTPIARLSPFVLEGHDAVPDVIADRIGAFRIVRAIGQGGMGQVFLGARDDGQFEQRVAIKLIRHPMPGVVRRFLEERRILALLEHRHIARLVDGGITRDGLPYFAMEFVDGEPIDRYCDARDLSLDQRLALFEDVCSAVSYAHQQLVIHRDLKPANILVTAEGEVKLLDFGIAKLLDPPSGAPRIEATRTGLQPMTPEVAAPEQMRGGPINTATDVYALGVLLYRLVSGERPYDLRDKSLLEIERLVCDDMPAPPSVKAPVHLRRRIRGDLDLIALTALQKDQQRRYQSAAALALDIQRFRQGRAIEARPDSARYRLQKFVARHRAAVGLSAAVLVALAAGIARERILRQRAEVEARKATEVESFLVGVFDVADPYAWSERDRGAISARELLDRGVKRIDTTLVAQPEVQAELRTVMGRVYTNLGLLQQATPLLERSLAQRIALRGENDTSVATSMDLLGMALAQQDKRDEAERLLRTGLDRRRKLLGTIHKSTAESIEHLATLYENTSRLAPAESLHREELAINTSLFGAGSREAAGSLNNLALVRYRRAAYADAESLYRRALDIELRTVGEKNARAAAMMQNLAQTLEQRRKLDEAEQYYRRSLAAKRAVLGEAHPSVTIGLNNFALFLANNFGRLDEAEAMIREALSLDRKIFGERHTYVAEGLRNLCVILRMKGQLSAADSAIRLALEIDRPLLGDRHERMALLYSQLAQVRYQMGDFPEAIRLTRETLSRFRETLGDSHRSTIITMGNLARLLTETGLGVEAESLSRASLVLLDSSDAGGRAQIAVTHRTLGAALLAQHRTDEALRVLERAQELCRREFGEDNYRTAYATMLYGNALAEKRRYTEAEPLLRSAQAILSKHRTDQPQFAKQADAAVARLAARSSR